MTIRKGQSDDLRDENVNEAINVSDDKTGAVNGSFRPFRWLRKNGARLTLYVGVFIAFQKALTVFIQDLEKQQTDFNEKFGD